MSDPAAITVGELDHIVLRCRDVEVTLAWYTELLGLEPLQVAEWRAGTVTFPSVRVNEGTIIDLFPADEEGGGPPVAVGGHLDHLCLSAAPFDPDALIASGRFRVKSGPVPRWGARGEATSVYVLDPDDTTVELRFYPPS